jgi:hypothetical protein
MKVRTGMEQVETLIVAVDIYKVFCWHRNLVRKSFVGYFGHIPVLLAEGSILRGLQVTYLINIRVSGLSNS